MTVVKERICVGYDCYGRYEYDDMYVIKDDNGKELYRSENDPTQLITAIKDSVIQKPFYTGGKQDLIRISSNSEDCIVDYDKSRRVYRVSIFEDDHFRDEFWFDAYKEVSEKWYSLRDKLPQLNELVDIKIVVDGKERFFLQTN